MRLRSMRSLRGDHRRLVRVLAAVAVVLVCVTAVAFASKPSKPAPDRDRDGLSDSFERSESHTKVRRRDSDRDRLGDGVEVERFHTNPLRRDTDRDRLGDWAEVKRFHTNPRRRDTDRDGIGDWAEVKRFKTNPRKRDSDGDALSDGLELKQYATDPLVPDSDGDGRTDGKEVEEGENPSVPGSGPVPPAPPQKRAQLPCSRTASSLDDLRSAVDDAAAGEAVCLADGSYGTLALDATKSAQVVIQPATSGGAILTGASLDGAHLTLSGFEIHGGVSIEAGSGQMTVEFNRVSGGGNGVFAGSSAAETADVTIRGNKFVGNFGEDAIRLDRYHDSGDSDPYGALVEGNEITGVFEDGAHNDCLQTVWRGDHLYVRRNYLHGNNCQGFFVKDQDGPIDTIVVEDNLIVDHTLPCEPTSLCPTWVLTPAQIWGPIEHLVVRNNTIWTPYRDGQVWWRGDGLSDVEIDHNVIYHGSSDTTVAGLSEHDNTVCSWDLPGNLAASSAHDCSPAFANAGKDDYRLGDERGVTWAPADQQYGP